MSNDNMQRRRFFEHQLGHFVWLVVLLVALCTATAIPDFGVGGFLGLSTTYWIVITVANMIIHQFNRLPRSSSRPSDMPTSGCITSSRRNPTCSASMVNCYSPFEWLVWPTADGELIWASL